jgi:predicted permease
MSVITWLETFRQDIRYGVWTLRKNPGLTALVLLCLGVGIGANTSIFSLTNLLLLRPLQISQPNQVVFVSRGAGVAPPGSYPDYLDYRNNNQVFSGLAAFSSISLSFGERGGSEVVPGEIVSGNYFSVLGVNAVAGRAFSPEEDRAPGAHPVVVISHKFWARRFNSDAAAVGKVVSLNGRQFTVIGIVPENFTSGIFVTPDVWVPMMMQQQIMSTQPDLLTNRRENWLGMIGRLRPGVNMEQAQIEMNVIDRQIAKTYPDITHDLGSGRALRLSQAHGIQIPHLRQKISLLSAFLTAVVTLVLLISCANVTNILLARATTRQKEIAIRQALGASRIRLLRQLLAESLILSLLGGAVGLVIAYWSNTLLSALKQPEPPPGIYSLDIRLDHRVLIFTFALSVMTGLIFGIFPALRASKHDVILALKDDSAPSRARFRFFTFRNLIIISQVAVSLVLLITAAVFLRSLQKMRSVDPGFNSENAFLISLDLETQGYSKERGREFYRRLSEQLKTLPGVQSVSRVNYFPLGFGNDNATISIDGKEPPPDGVDVTVKSYNIDPEFFNLMGIPFLRGRNFSDQDREGTPAVAIINEKMGDRFWPGEDPIGKRFRSGGPQGQLIEVIGVSKNIKYRFLSEDPRAAIYVSHHQRYSPNMNMLVRTVAHSNGVMKAARDQVRALDENLPIKTMMSFDQVLHDSSYFMRIGASFTGIVGLLGLLLTLAGMYGVMAYSVARRTREIGIRMALGASPSQVIRLVIKQGLFIMAIGLIIGLPLALVVLRLLAKFLYGVSVTDPVLLLVAPLLLVAVSLLACYFPARKAANLNPSMALRTE